MRLESDTAVPSSSRQRGRQDVAAVLDLIANCHEALVTARDAQGIMRTSLVDVRRSDAKTVTFAADPALQEQIRHSPEILLTYAERTSGRWLVLNGIARLRRPRPASWRPELPGWLARGGGRGARDIDVQVLAADLWD